MNELVSGSRVNKLILIERADDPTKSRNSCKRWLCRCDCGRETTVDVMRLKCKRVNGCRFCASKGRANTWSRKESGRSMKNRLIHNYRKSARSKNLPFEISDELMTELFKGRCHYCGRAPYKAYHATNRYGAFVANGIDRLVVSRGYEIGNVVSCCWECNFMKRAYSETEFRAMVTEIAKNLLSHLQDYEI